ncbi:hypothetical protein BD769DRAFT_1362609, partial [Suillus cothurnatus]
DKSKSMTFQEFVKKHPSVFKIPLVALQDLELMNKLDSMIKELLTQQRGSMKQKIITSTDRGSNIHALCRSLSGNCTEITSAHWSCVAFLRSSLIQFRTVVAESAKLQEEVTSNSNIAPVPADLEGDKVEPSPSVLTQCTWTFNQYWSYIDVLLDELRNNAKKNTSTIQAAEEFTKKCVLLLLAYPSTTTLAPSLDSVTMDCQKTIHSKLIW